VWFASRRLRREAVPDNGAHTSAVIGAACALLMLLGLVGSATLDR
jgi:hypothetical protein